MGRKVRPCDSEEMVVAEVLDMVRMTVVIFCFQVA